MIHNNLNMKNFFILVKILFACMFLMSNVLAKESNFLKEGIELFQKKELDKSKILFEKDIVFDPKSERSYLYLAKIFEKKENDEEQEINLNSVLLLNPKNDEALYMLTLLKIKQSDYKSAKKLLDEFILVCDSFCSKKKELKEKFEKMNPDNAKNNN